MKIIKLINIFLFIWIVTTFSNSLEAQGLGKALMRGASKGAARATRRSMGKILRKDFLRDLSSKQSALPRNRTVFRYTSPTQTRMELHQGVKAGSHMTSKATAGRPLSSSNAQGRYGLPQEPGVRMTIRLPKGTPVRHNRALGGDRGIGEITTIRRMPPNMIKRVVPLKSRSRLEKKTRKR